MLLNNPLLSAKYNFLYKKLSVDGNRKPTIKYHSIEEVAKASNDICANIVEQCTVIHSAQSLNINDIYISAYHADESCQLFMDMTNLLAFYDLIEKLPAHNSSSFLHENPSILYDRLHMRFLLENANLLLL